MKGLEDISRIFATNTKKATIVSIILIIVVSYGLFYYLQNNTETDIKNSLYQQQEQRQIESTEALSRHIGSDLGSIMSKLELLSNSATMQQGMLVGNRTTDLLDKAYRQINSITPLRQAFYFRQEQYSNNQHSC
jgi:hypothetical protein